MPRRKRRSGAIDLGESNCLPTERRPRNGCRLDALSRLAGDIHAAVNVLHDRPEDWSDYAGAMDRLR